jgi:hypothetical protein
MKLQSLFTLAMVSRLLATGNALAQSEFWKDHDLN